MRGLNELLGTDAGRALLAERGVHCAPAAFTAELHPPADPSLSGMVEVPADVPLVYIGQQACADYVAAVTTKFETARLLDGVGVAPVVLWHDLDRADSERFGMRFLLPTEGRPRSVRLAHRSLADREARFVPVDRERLEQLFADLGTWAEQCRPDRRAAARARVAALAEAVLSRPVPTLGAANAALAGHLLRARLRVDVPSVLLSTLLERGMFTAPLNAYLSALDDVVRVFNHAVDALLAADVDPHVRPLADDYLPLFLSCPRCGVRRRLVHERAAADHYASVVCRCGAEHRFHLGSRTLSLGELEASGRWSPDVSLPVHLNHLASGMVAGRSSALYGLVLNEVMERALGVRPIPALVPAGLPTDAGAGETLLLGYLTA
jgi:hypothetical protein